MRWDRDAQLYFRISAADSSLQASIPTPFKFSPHSTSCCRFASFFIYSTPLSSFYDFTLGLKDHPEDNKHYDSHSQQDHHPQLRFMYDMPTCSIQIRSPTVAAPIFRLLRPSWPLYSPVHSNPFIHACFHPNSSFIHPLHSLIPMPTNHLCQPMPVYVEQLDVSAASLTRLTSPHWVGKVVGVKVGRAVHGPVRARG